MYFHKDTKKERKTRRKTTNRISTATDKQTNEQNGNKLTGNTLVNKETLIINHKNKHKQEAQMLS